MNHEEQLTVLNKIYGEYIDFDSGVKTVSNYSHLAADYEKDVVTCGYNIPQTLVKVAKEFWPQQTKDFRIFDVACGTGMVGDELIKSGFEGTIEGTDASKGMLSIAKGKNIYKKLIELFIYPDTRLPLEDCVYDAVFCAGSLGPVHLDPETLNEFVRVLKPGGLIVFSTRIHKLADAYVKHLNKVIQQLEEEKKWKLKNEVKTTYFDVDFANPESGPTNAVVFCFQKCF